MVLGNEESQSLKIKQIEMKKVFKTIVIMLGLVSFAQAAPVTVTINVPGGFVRTDRWEDPSTCRTFDRIVCNANTSVCYRLTYTYDDAAVANRGGGLEEGKQTPPVHVVLMDSNGAIINEGMVSFYQDYAVLEGTSLLAAYEYTFSHNQN
ncbi:MAG: hypothetical protein COA58_04675 [Bacteroidetes bacterium]|nr:MAG: hypothetical protein COA58_04675 [Bacteroidota bacterium]